MTDTTKRDDRIVVSLDPEAMTALDRARREDRLSRPAYARAVIARHLKSGGHLPTEKVAR
ncbi:hypothetical protein ASF24_08220 [Methylobacterium sp. Leaf86]|uniref:hypothetical protein n=1 Tax=Methylobacterium sp. Leaf86 TaxID=1736242 RepID=UPI0006F5AD09|nr:hypothetical protein [Methylobacterium sp. Leaf86]KQO49154.1 hypothetical protein ASF24_08220 [Methylobacterium sp. Leaf86]